MVNNPSRGGAEQLESRWDRTIFTGTSMVLSGIERVPCIFAFCPLDFCLGRVGTGMLR